MNRRTIAFGLVAASLLPGMLGASAADPPPKPEYPRAGCAKRLVDPPGDAYTNPGGVGLNQIKTDGLDIIGTLLRVTPDQVQAFVQLKDVPAPADMENYSSVFRYTVTFTYEGKVFVVTTGQVNPDVDPNGGNAAANKFPTSNPVIIGATGGVDATADIAWVALPRAAFEEKAGTPLVEDARFTAISAKSDQSVAANKFYDADTMTPAAAAAVWTIGDEYCFGAPPGALSDVATPAAQFGDASAFTAKLVDEKGATVAGAPVQFAVTSATGAVLGTVTGTTDDAGVATAAYTVAVPAGTYPVKVTFAGNTEVGKAKATGSLVVGTETTKFNPLAVAKPSTTTRAVTATLLDDDRKPVAGQRVDFYVNGRKATTLATDKAGKAVLKTAKPGQTVQAKLVAVAGKYTAATSDSKKV